MKLYGFLNPLGRFPSLVIPVWVDKDENYFGSFDFISELGIPGRKLQRINLTNVHKVSENLDDSSIKGFDPTEVGLLALDLEYVVAYPIKNEQKILEEFLRDRSFSADQPFIRLALAKVTKSKELIIAELLAASFYLLTKEIISNDNKGRERLELWLSQEKESLSELLIGDSDKSNFPIELPSKLEDLGRITWWRDHLMQQRSKYLWTLREMEDRKPSPVHVVVLNINPVVPNHAMLEIMARHLLSGTNYLFFHAPTASFEERNKLKQATDQAVEKAKSRAKGPLGGFSELTLGKVKFYKLAREWTGSPYVFYEELGEDGSRVIGYRGIEVGASISKYYEKLPDDFSFEILEALTSNAPSDDDFSLKRPDGTYSIEHGREKYRN